jgi:DNA-binding CsgD family transcriptional regulator
VHRPTVADTEACRSRSGEPRSFGISGLHAVTARQVECLYWVFQGKSASDIGGILGISGRVVEEHLQKACAHFEVKSRHQAAWRAHERGLFAEIAP